MQPISHLSRWYWLAMCREGQTTYCAVVAHQPCWVASADNTCAPSRLHEAERRLLESAALVSRHDEDAKQCGAAFAREAIAAFRAEFWVGSVACKHCHEAEYAAWENSRHSHAMASLRDKQEEKNPNCMKCHLQDLPARAATEIVRGIGCESCHGGGLAHVVALRSGTPYVAARTFRTGLNGTCVACHDEVNSPRFDEAEYWKWIAHGVVGEG